MVLESGWIADHAAEADVLHLHFGLESFGVDQLVADVDAAHEAGWPVVQTVHDLENPQLTDQSAHTRQLDGLLPIVDSLITLTPGAAAEIERRWGRQAIVLPHPRILQDELRPSLGPRHDVPLIGVHLKDLRPNVDGPGVVRLLAEALDRLAERGTRAAGEVRLHRNVRDPDARDAVRALCASRDDIVLLEHDRLDDAQLANVLSHLDICVLPYRAGTHSGWLELCWDLGVAVAAPRIGYFDEQHPDSTVMTFSRNDEGASLADSIGRLIATSPPSGSSERSRLRATRRRLREESDAATALTHVDLFRALLDARRS